MSKGLAPQDKERLLAGSMKLAEEFKDYLEFLRREIPGVDPSYAFQGWMIEKLAGLHIAISLLADASCELDAASYHSVHSLRGRRLVAKRRSLARWNEE